MTAPGIHTIAAHELRRLLVTPLPWVLLALTQLILGVVFLTTLGELREDPSMAREEGVTAVVAGGVFGFAAAWLMLVVPLLGMRSLSEELRSGAIRLIATAPVPLHRIVLGKYLALLAPLLAVVLLTALMPASLMVATSVDWGLLAAATLQLSLLGAAYAAVALGCSSLTRQPAAAAVAALGILLFLWLLYWLGTRDIALAGLFRFLSPAEHLENALAGLMSVRGVLQPVLLSGLFLALAMIRLGLRGHTGSLGAHLQGLRQHARLSLVWTVVLMAIVLVAFTRSDHGDWSAAGRHTLSDDSVRILQQLDGPLDVVAYAPPEEALRGDLRRLVTRYMERYPDMSLTFVDPAAAPDKLRRLGVQEQPWALAITHGQRTEVCARSTEQCMTRALQRLAREAGQWVAFLTGHGERSLRKESDTSLTRFAEALQASGLSVGTLDLTQTPRIPDNASVLILAGPRSAPLEGELRILGEFIEEGGALLWLADPDSADGWGALAEPLGVRLLSGVVLYPDYRLLGTPHPAVIPVTDFGNHAATRQLDASVMFSFARPLSRLDQSDWEARVFARTLERSWAETGALEGELGYDPAAGDRPGPLVLGMGLERKAPGSHQRAAVVGDADFISNRYLDHGDNLRLGLNLVNWLLATEEQLDIQPGELPDARLTLSATASRTLLALFIPGIPALMLGAGVLIWWRRR